jgi:acetyl esterase/lipase
MNVRRVTILLKAIFVIGWASAQSTAGITNVPDTSFTVQHEYDKNKKNHPQIKIVGDQGSNRIREKRGLVYCKLGERKLALDVFYPAAKAKKKRPAVMIIFGGGWRSGNRMQHHPLAQRLADSGYVCFTPEYRLSTEALYPAAVYDLKAALRWIRANAKKYGVDENKIAVMGFSAGGQLASLLGVTSGNADFEGSNCNLSKSSAVNAVIDLDGTLSFVHAESGEGDDSKKTSAATFWFGYSKKENPGLWQQASPLTYAGKNTPPTLFINSSVARMHAGRDDFMKVLQAHQIFTDVKTFADAPHSFPFFDPWFEPMVKYVDDFLKQVFGFTRGRKEKKVQAN